MFVLTLIPNSKHLFIWFWSASPRMCVKHAVIRKKDSVWAVIIICFVLSINSFYPSNARKKNTKQILFFHCKRGMDSWQICPGRIPRNRCLLCPNALSTTLTAHNINYVHVQSVCKRNSAKRAHLGLSNRACKWLVWLHVFVSDKYVKQCGCLKTKTPFTHGIKMCPGPFNGK